MDSSILRHFSYSSSPSKIACGRYSKLEKEYREALAEKEKLQDELTERRRRSLMIGWFVYSRIYFSIVTNRNSA